MMELAWSSKEATKKELAQSNEHESLYPVYEDDQIILYEESNIDFLLQDKTYYDIIYIDPPYNTKQKFLTYNDNFSISIKEYKKRNNIDSKEPLTTTQEMERLHEEWLNLYYKTVFLLKNRLKDDGIFFCSLDDNELYNAKLICDEIFGPECFVGTYHWVRTETPANLSKKIKKKIEYILCYTKTKNNHRFFGIQKKSKSSNGLMNQSNKEHTLIFNKDNIITKIPDKKYLAGSYGTKSYNITLLEDCIVKDGKPQNDIILRGKFKWSQEYLDDFIDKQLGEIYIASTVFSPSYIKFSDNRDVPSNLISKNDCNVGTSENATKELADTLESNLFDYPKPIELLEYLCGFNGKTEQHILDVFAGSGTTGIAALQHNMKTSEHWKTTLVEQNHDNVDIIQKRIRTCTKSS